MESRLTTRKSNRSRVRLIVGRASRALISNLRSELWNRPWIRLLISLIILIAIGPLIVTGSVNSYYYQLATDDIQQLRRSQTAIVFGASAAYGVPSPILQSRLDAVVDLYEQDLVERILLTGDNSVEYYNEPETMRAYLLEQDVPEFVIEVDPAGTRTLESCERAYEIYNVSDAILVTQHFHMARALYLCDAEGIQVQGYTSDREELDTLGNYLRELLATPLAIWETVVVND